ncbi:hypothetical protein ACCO45_001487 [Purpureocillium lilacinum]|uniref:Uncharacterized protein n=1 Tax=Purpureocillium lilacinum TaxID=33203 RepID=A0ACC4E828_PURLI
MRCTVAARQAISAALLHKFMQGVKGGNNTPLVGVARNLLAEQGVRLYKPGSRKTYDTPPTSYGTTDVFPTLANKPGLLDPEARDPTSWLPNSPGPDVAVVRLGRRRVYE